LLPLDDCLYVLQLTIPSLTRSFLHRWLTRRGISRLPELDCDKPNEKRFASYPIGYFHIDIAEIPAEEGKLRLFLLTVGKVTGWSCDAPQHDPAHGGVDHRHAGFRQPLVVSGETA
jgi:hypothetical protein